MKNLDKSRQAARQENFQASKPAAGQRVIQESKKEDPVSREEIKKTQIREVAIGFKSFVVRSHTRKCKNGHIVEPVRAVIDIMLSAGTVVTEKIPATYCKACNMYFILDHDFRRLRESGVLLCQVLSNDSYVKENYASFGAANLKPESLLHQSGYNVGTSDNLTAIQRQEILRRVIDNGLYSKSELTRFLDWLISRNRKTNKKNMASAVSKWQADKMFVANHRSSGRR